MVVPMRIAGIIIAGGRGTRLAQGEKPLVRFGDGTLLDAVVSRARPQVESLALNVRAEAHPLYRVWAEAGMPLIPDAFEGAKGPLGGVLAGLEWIDTRDMELLATFPGDTPFLPRDLVAALLLASEAGRPAVAFDGTRTQSLCALWPRSCAAALRAGVEKGIFKSVRDAFAAFGAVACRIAAPGAFFNVNTPEDLKEAERIARAQ